MKKENSLSAIMTRRETPSSSSSVAPKRPLRKQWTGAGAAVILSQALVGRTDATAACTVAVTNNWNMSIALDSYAGSDTSCTDPYGAYLVNGNGDCKSTGCSFVGLGCSPDFHLTHTHMIPPFCLLAMPPISHLTAAVMECNSTVNCRIRLYEIDGNVVSDPDSCSGTDSITCEAQLNFYIDAGGGYVWSVNEVVGTDDNAARSLLGAEEVQAAAKSDVLSSLIPVSSRTVTVIKEGVEIGTGRSLRGAKRSTRNM
jgi:hypothetical protein